MVFISAGNAADTVADTCGCCGGHWAMLWRALGWTLWRIYGVITELGTYFLLPFAALATGMKLMA